VYDATLRAIGLLGDATSPKGDEDGKAKTTGGSSADLSNATSLGSEPHVERVFIVSNSLPLIMREDEEAGKPYGHKYAFEANGDSIYDQCREGAAANGQFSSVINVGQLPMQVPWDLQDAVAQDLENRFDSVPVFLPDECKENFYKGFCKQYLWPLMHYVLPMSPMDSRFQKYQWQAYIAANKRFADRLMEVVSSDDDQVWVHDYHLMLLPTFMRKRFNAVKLGFFLHCPFPSSEIFRTTPTRDLILRGLLNADFVGFHTFDYARHFLSCCTRLLGLHYKMERGALVIDNFGRTVSVKICPTGVKTSRLREVLTTDICKSRRKELIAELDGRRMLLGLDDFDEFKGIDQKLAAFENMLEQHPEIAEQIILYQICNPPRGSGRDIDDLRKAVDEMVDRINNKYSKNGVKVINFQAKPVPLHERIALYSVADVAVVTATRDGMNLAPYEYVTCRQGPEDEASGTADGFALPRTSSLIISEFTGCSPSLSGAVRVNPWHVEDVADSIYKVLQMSGREHEARHEKHWRYVNEHHVGFWAQSCLAELQRVTEKASSNRCYGLGFGLNFRVVHLSSTFRKLDTSLVVSDYLKSKHRKLIIDYDGTLVPLASFAQPPSAHLLSLLTVLVNDEANEVCIVSGRERETLDKWFGNIPGLCMVAEHGYWFRGGTDVRWKELAPSGTDTSVLEWKDTVLPILEQYMEATDGSFIQSKESSFVWHYRDADPDFGAWQAKELIDHLESVLSNDAVDVISGNGTVEVKPRGVHKGLVINELLATGSSNAAPDFVMAIGDDRSDEDMFVAVSAHAQQPLYAGCTVYTSTIGQKPSKAPAYLDDTDDVVNLLQTLAQYNVCHRH
jgi:trehalose 6-phosphate synthase/phosphatase